MQDPISRSHPFSLAWYRVLGSLIQGDPAISRPYVASILRALRNNGEGYLAKQAKGYVTYVGYPSR